MESKTKAEKAGVYATPTFFVNNNVLVAPKTIKELENAIKKELTTN